MAGIAATLVYVTCRREPAFEWFADSLLRQLAHGDDLDLVVVDLMHDASRTQRFTRSVRDRLALRHVPAKPSPYNGPHRLTRRDHFAAASARNTGLVHARKPYVVFVDDCSVLGPRWLQAVREAAAAGYVVAGAYRKHRRMVVRDGVLVSSAWLGRDVDTRWRLGNRSRPVRIDGGRLYGASFGAPRELLLSVNGLDELCDTMGGEDYHLGTRLEFAGAAILYDLRMLSVESTEHHDRGGTFTRLARRLGREAYMERLAAFGVHHRTTSGDFDSPHMVLDLLHGIGTAATLGNYYWLAELDEAGLAATPRRFPRAHWFDGTPLAEL